MDPSAFYDDLAEWYHLIFADWEDSQRRQGAVLDRILAGLPGLPSPRSRIRLLDVAAGIGTQALPLAALGYQVTARDLSAGAIRRLTREASNRGLSLDADVADMRSVSRTTHGPYHVVMALDNAVPHLLDEASIHRALVEMRGLALEGGHLLVSVRDYGAVDRRPESVHPYGERVADGRRYRIRQEWAWLDQDHYCTTFVGERQEGREWVEFLRTAATYFAIAKNRLMQLMSEAGWGDVREVEGFYQPILAGRVSRAPVADDHRTLNRPRHDR